MIFMRQAHGSHQVLPASACSLVPDEIDLKEACWCGLAKTALRAAWAGRFELGKDILIIGAMLLSWVLGRPVPVRPLLVSKANTVAQIILALMVLGDLGFSLGLARVIGVSVWVAGGLTVVSAGAYLVNWLTFMASYEDHQPQPHASRAPRPKQRAQRPKEPVSGI